jgi:hypothetical protein
MSYALKILVALLKGRSALEPRRQCQHLLPTPATMIKRKAIEEN